MRLLRNFIVINNLKDNVFTGAVLHDNVSKLLCVADMLFSRHYAKHA